MSGVLDRIYEHSPAFIQNIGISLYGAKIYFREYGKKLEKALAELEKTEKYSASELAEFQNEKLRALIRHAYEHIPYYREIMRQRKLVPDDIQSTKDLPKLPILTRQDVEKYSDKLIATNVNKSKLVPGGTGGTTGAPLKFYWDERTCLMKTAVDWRQKKWGGITVGDKMALFWGRILIPPDQNKPPFWRYNWTLNQLYFSSYHLSTKNLSSYLTQMEKFSPKAIEGYPSTVSVFAQYLVNNGITYPLQAVFTSSESLYPHQREVMEKAFACKVFDFYGMAERVIFATECSAHEGHHINADFGITEILDNDGNPVVDGSIGRIIGTGLYNFAMPLIRYKTSDVTAIRPKQCSCGRNFPLMDDVTTRAEDIITTKDGRFISYASLTLPIKITDKIEASQIIQEDKETIIVKVVVRPGYQDTDGENILSEFKKRIGADMNVSIDIVDSIPRTKSGKFRFVISKVPLKV